MERENRIVVLRLGHRPYRDKRITTHVGLVARTFGADELILTTEDKGVIESIEDVKERWGGDFTVKVVEDWRDYIRSWKGSIVHLTMYGLPVDEKIEDIISSNEDLLVVIGAEKVPPDVYKSSHFNVAIGLQPHSEVSALAIFLDRYFKGQELEKEFGGMTRVIPSDNGKNAIIGK